MLNVTIPEREMSSIQISSTGHLLSLSLYGFHLYKLLPISNSNNDRIYTPKLLSSYQPKTKIPLVRYSHFKSHPTYSCAVTDHRRRQTNTSSHGFADDTHISVALSHQDAGNHELHERSFQCRRF